MHAGNRVECDTRIGGFGLAYCTQVYYVVNSIARRGWINSHMEAIAALRISGHPSRSLLAPCSSPIGAQEQPNWVWGIPVPDRVT